MSERMLVVIAVAVLILLIAIVAAAVYGAKKRRSARLRSRFGPEYDRVVREQEDVARAEAALEERERPARKFVVRPLSPEERERFIKAWRDVQARFVDDPGKALAEADRLVDELAGLSGGQFRRASGRCVRPSIIPWSFRATALLM